MPDDPRCCGTCRWHSEFIPGDEEEEARYLCDLPSERLPLSMRGVPERERQIVPHSATGCPAWEAPDA